MKEFFAIIYASELVKISLLFVNLELILIIANTETLGGHKNNEKWEKCELE